MVHKALVVTFLFLIGGAFLITSSIRLGLVKGRFLRRYFWPSPISPHKNALEEKVLPEADLKTYPVKYLSSKSARSPWRIVPWDASGKLVQTQEGFSFKGKSKYGQMWDLEFDPDDSVINYQKGKLLWDGGLSWCVVEVDGEKHYFTSDLTKSSLIEDSKRTVTTDVYEQLTARYLKLDS